MPLAVAREPFDIPIECTKWSGDGFRALAYIDGHQCKLVSRRGREYKSWPCLCTELWRVPKRDIAEEVASLNADDALVAFSDGVVEALNCDGAEFGEERLLSAVTLYRDASAALFDDICRDTLPARARQRLRPRLLVVGIASTPATMDASRCSLPSVGVTRTRACLC